MNRIGQLVEDVRGRFEAQGVALINCTTGSTISSSGECDIVSTWLSDYGGSLPPWPFTSFLHSPLIGDLRVLASPAGKLPNHIWLLVIEPGNTLVESSDWANVLASLARHAFRLQSTS